MAEGCGKGYRTGDLWVQNDADERIGTIAEALIGRD
jgi:hypothetical protein